MTEQKKAIHKNITAEKDAYSALRFVLSDSDENNVEGKNVFFVISESEYEPDPIIIRDQSNIALDENTITVKLESSDLTWLGYRWYEVWVEWERNQWQKEFKGFFKLVDSVDYDQED